MSPTRHRRFPRWAWIASAAAAVVVIAGISIAIAANNSSHTKARAAAASSASAAAASSQAAAAQSASAAAQSAAESQAAEASSQAQAASESAAAAAMNLHSGDTASLTSTNDDGTTSDFTATVVIHPNAKPAGEFTIPTEKGQYVVADVTIKVTSGSYNYNPFDFQEQSGNGQIWQPTFATGFDPMLNAGTAAAGQTARGNVVFDVPRGPIQVQLTGGLGQATAAAWNG
jgi:FtsP/CotA-like multicopper oxidase with cupredoxin domain